MSLISTSIKRPIFITCVFILLIVVGYTSLKKLPIDIYPDITFPIVLVTTAYPGAGPKEVETLVSKVIEDELSSISGVKNLRSINTEGVSTIIVEFNSKTDIKYAEQQVRDRIASVARKLPEDIEDSTIRRIDPSDQPVVAIGISAEMEPSKIYDLASEQLRPRIQQVDHVGLVEVVGGRKREIQVQLDQDKLAEYQISASQVADRIRAAGENVPAGRVSEDKQELVYRTLAEFRSVKEIESTVVSFFANETAVRVKDLGKVVDTLEDETSRAYLNGEAAIILQVFRQTGSNTVAVVESVKDRVEKLNESFKNDPRKIKLTILRDHARFIYANIVDVRESIFFGILLTIIVVFYFLGNARSTFITSMALPNSLLGAFVLMAFAGFSVNIMSLLALSLSVGLLVDDAIVVRENIFRHMELGSPPAKAALEGATEVVLAVLATTATVIAVFGPIGFLEGVVGQFFKQFGLTVCFALIISLFDSLTMAPMMSAYLAGRVHAKSTSKPGFFGSLWDSTVGRSTRAFSKFQDKLVEWYGGTLEFVLTWPKTILLGAFGIFVAGILILAFVPKTFLPAQDVGEFGVNLEMPPGTSIEGMYGVAKQVDEVIRSNKEVLTSQLIIGNRSLESNVATFFVGLVPMKQRSMNTSEMKEKLRGQLKQFQYANPIVGDIDNAGMGARPFNLNISGSDLVVLDEFAKKVFERLKNHPAFKDVEYGSKPGKPEFQFVIDPQKAEMLGVSTKMAGIELRTLVEGATPAVFREEGLEYKIRVRSSENQRKLKERVNKVLVPNINNRLIRMTEIASPGEKTGPAVINRENRNRYIGISADIAPNGPGMGGAIQDINNMFVTDLKPPPGISYRYFGQAENFQELQKNMANALLLGIIFIYLVLASLYESFITPFTIMLVLPLALCGAFYALFITGKSLDIFSMIGCILLLGVATKNSILLVDYANHMLAQGVNRRDAILQAGKIRLRPILMTSFALIAGMLPIAIGLNEASRQRTSMGVAIIGGLISSTFLTLLVVPAAFSYIDRFGAWVKNFFNRFVAGDSKV